MVYDSSEVFNSDAGECDEAVVDRELNLVNYVEMVVEEEVLISVHKAA